MRANLRGVSLRSLAVLILALVIAACGEAAPTSTATRPPATATSAATPSSPTVAPTATRPPATVAPTATPLPPPTATAAPQSTGELVFALPTLADFLLNAGQGPAQHPAYLDPMYTWMISTKEDGSFDAASGLVASWTANADSSVWTFKTRGDVVFQTGDKVTAKDAAYTLNLGIDPAQKWARQPEIAKSVKTIQTPDDVTMVVTLNVPDIFWNFNYLGRMGPYSASSKVVVSQAYLTKVGMAEANKVPVGSGPYKHKSAAVGDRIVMEAVASHFFFGVPRTKTITFQGIPEETTRMSLLQTKTADAAPISLSASKQATAAGLTLVSRAGSLTAEIYNMQYPDTVKTGPNVLANENARKALFYHGIDRKALLDSFFAGQGTPSMDYPVMKWDIGARTALAVPAFDQAKAKQLLADAGFGPGKGFEIDMYAQAVTTPSGGEQVMEAIAVYWEQLGGKINRMPFTGSTAISAVIAAAGKGGFEKATVMGLSLIGNRQLTGTTALTQNDPKGLFAVSRDPEGFRLATAFAGAKSVDEYIKAGEAYRQYNNAHAASWQILFELNEIWARSSKISEKWKLGQDAPYFRLDYAAALR